MSPLPEQGTQGLELVPVLRWPPSGAARGRSRCRGTPAAAAPGGSGARPLAAPWPLRQVLAAAYGYSESQGRMRRQKAILVVRRRFFLHDHSLRARGHRAPS